MRTRTHFDRSSMQERAHCRPRSIAGRPRRHGAQQHAKWACTVSPKVTPATFARFRNHAHAHIAKVCKHAPATQQTFPLPPLPPPADTRPVRAPTVARFREPWVGTMTSRSVKPPSRWSSQIDASVTMASSIDLWTRESVSARSRAYSRLRWGVRGSIARSPNGFPPRPRAPSRSCVQLTGTRT